MEPSEIPRDEGLHEEEFLARYRQLRASALRLTAGDAARAEDLVHDAFVQFTLARPRLGRVENLDGYLYQMLRNLHLSQLRRARRRGEDAPAVVEFDSAEVALRAYTDPRDSIRVQDGLRQVCRYASLRKETSKAGSVLILRFMHGYYPGEIASVCRSTREAVEERLRNARGEARQFLKDPSSLRFIKRDAAAASTPTHTGFAQTHEELLADLRRRVFDSRRGECLTKETLSEIYTGADARQPDTATLAHVVSCPRCIDEVNSLNGLPPLSERFPTDALGAEPRGRKGGGDDGTGKGSGGSGGAGDDGTNGGEGTGGANAEETRRVRRRARDVYEHRPRELCVAVNGRLLGTQKVASVLSEQRLNVGAGEGVDFIEVFSEQDVRLLYLDPAAWPAEADGGRALSVRLSDRRTLEARLSYDGPTPTVQVVYRDPLMADAYASQPSTLEDEAAQGVEFTDGDSRQERERTGTLPHASAWRSLSERLAKTFGWLARPFTHFRPGWVAAALAVLVVAALLFTRLYVPPVSAAELLRRAAAAEQTATAPDVVTHRTVFVEEERAEGRRSVVTRRRVETWQGGASGIRVRRLFDEQGRLAAGELTNSDGTSELLRRGSAPEKAGAATPSELLAAGELWRVEPSAANFAALAPADDALKVEDRLGTYVLRREASETNEGIVRAELWLNKADLHAFRMTLAVRRGGETVEYRLIEGGLERRRAVEVPPAVYQLEPELLGAARATKDERGAVQTQVGDGGQPSHGETQTPAVASAELEVEVAYLLNKIKANLGEQVSMGRTTGGALRVEALVESEERKGAILSALGPVLNNPAVVVEVSTVAEALAKRKPERGENVTEREVVVAAGRIPADAELRAHFAARLADPERVDAEIKEFAARAMTHSRQALLHASALKRLANRFTPAQARGLSDDARAKWLAMVREHASAYARETAALRAQLSSVFGGGAGGGSEAVGDADASQAAERLLQLSYAQDAAVRSAFTISEDARSAAAVKSPQFWRTLAASERLAAEIQKAYER
ncbi:MAG TPA: RNA polymerase sigma factor [Pyrinomonadaceae bacterium]|nr:RNA polymerase sigma factor [Pyrinomonadaceae bacterium]